MFSNLNGWQRPGVIISFAWAVFIVGITARQYLEAGEFDDALSGDCPSFPGGVVQWYDAASGKEISLFHKDEKSVDCNVIKERAKILTEANNRGLINPVIKIHYRRVLAAVTLPILVFWLSVYFMVWLFRWVVDGFKLKKE
jgi:hypothetical protein